MRSLSSLAEAKRGPRRLRIDWHKKIDVLPSRVMNETWFMERRIECVLKLAGKSVCFLTGQTNEC